MLNLFPGIEGKQLRYFTPEGELVLTSEEDATRAINQVSRLQAKLLELGIDPKNI